VRLRAWLVNAFIVGHVSTIAAWSIPTPLQPVPVRALNRLTAPYMRGLGLWQGWDLFAPDPLTVNIDVEAEVTFRDGRRVLWVFPRMEELSYFDRYRKERYRKWRERVRLDTYRSVWPDTAGYVGRLYDGPGHPVVAVALIRRWVEIPAPVGPWLPSRLSAVATTFSYQFFATPFGSEVPP
jgi:hypothetical protein